MDRKDEEIEKMKEEIILRYKPQEKVVQELMAELNGKVMDYNTCKLLEKFFKEYNVQSINILVGVLLGLKKKGLIKNE